MAHAFPAAAFRCRCCQIILHRCNVGPTLVKPELFLSTISMFVSSFCIAQLVTYAASCKCKFCWILSRLFRVLPRPDFSHRQVCCWSWGLQGAGWPTSYLMYTWTPRVGPCRRWRQSRHNCIVIAWPRVRNRTIGLRLKDELSWRRISPPRL